MEYSKLVAVTGLPGLFELISSKNDGAVVRSLEDNSTKFASSRIHNFSHLESIEVYTTGDNVNLVDVFHAMEKDGKDLPDTKDAGAVRKYFEKIYKDLDFERVYPSDLKKMIKWFDILKKNNIEIKLTPPVEEETIEAHEAKEEVVEKPKSKAEKPATSADKKEGKAKKEASEEKAAPKKAVAKKKDEDKKEKPAKKSPDKKPGKK
jgi:hypothetical protein